MSILEILLIGVALSMDAFAVTVSNSMVYTSLSKKEYMGMPVTFGIFQGAMPLLGCFLGSLFAEIIDRYSGIVILLILGIIGGKMIIDGVKELKTEAEEGTEKKTNLKFSILLFQGFATSIDAFAVGVSFAAAHVNIWGASGLIALTTFVLTIVAILCGKAAGKKLGDKAQIIGGIVLVIIGIKAMI